MYQHCEECGRRYNDEFCSTCCPHKGIGYCAVCDCVICVCDPKYTRDWERSSNNNAPLTEPNDALAETEKGVGVAGNEKPVWVKPNWETECPASDDKQHCDHWYDGQRCCRCGAAMRYWDALEAVNDADAKIARYGWNGKDQWVTVQRPDEHSKMTKSYLYIHTVQGDLVPWFPSQTDQFGDDWYIVE